MKKHLNHFSIFALLFTGVFLSSCRQDIPQQKMKNNKLSQSNITTPLPQLNPVDAKIKITTPVSLISIAQNSSLQVPGFSMLFDGADFVQVARCNSDYTVSIEEKSTSALKAVWFNDVIRLGGRNDCTIVGTKSTGGNPSGGGITSPIFKDYSNKGGSYYYIVNPCVSAQRSTSGKEECNYNLQITENFNHKNSLKAEFITEAETLSSLDATLGGYYNSYAFNIENAKRQMNDCDANYGTQERNKKFWFGLAGLGTITATTIVGAVVSQGNPAVTMAAANAGVMLSGVILNMYQAGDAKCPDAEKSLLEAKNLFSKVKETQCAVIKQRNKMGKIDAQYGQLEKLQLNNHGKEVAEEPSATSQPSTDDTSGQEYQFCNPNAPPIVDNQDFNVNEKGELVYKGESLGKV